MSPRLAMASPSPSSAAFSALSVVPDRTVTSPVLLSAATIPVHSDRSTAIPSVAATAVKECPLPSARTRSPAPAASLTATAISPALRGRRHRAGRALAVPAQFRHSPRSEDRIITAEYSYFLAPVTPSHLRKQEEVAVTAEYSYHRGPVLSSDRQRPNPISS